MFKRKLLFEISFNKIRINELHGNLCLKQEQGSGEEKLKIGVSVGDFDKIRGLSKYDIIVATSERADSLIRHNPPWLTEVGCLVSDEIHLINDSNRGPTLEVTLSKFREINPEIQIIGLSATVGNPEEAGRFLVGSDRKFQLIHDTSLRNYDVDVVFVDGIMDDVAVKIIEPDFCLSIC